MAFDFINRMTFHNLAARLSDDEIDLPAKLDELDCNGESMRRKERRIVYDKAQFLRQVTAPNRKSWSGQ